MISISHSEYCTDLGGEDTYKSLDFFELKVIMLTRNEGEALATQIKRRDEIGQGAIRTVATRTAYVLFNLAPIIIQPHLSENSWHLC